MVGCAVSQAFVFPAAEIDFGGLGAQPKERPHGPECGRMIEIGRLQSKTAVMQLMFFQKAHGTIFNFNPLDEVLLKKAEALHLECREDSLPAG